MWQCNGGEGRGVVASAMCGCVALWVVAVVLWWCGGVPVCRCAGGTARCSDDGAVEQFGGVVPWSGRVAM